jgi:hypothetical protein
MQTISKRQALPSAAFSALCQRGKAARLERGLERLFGSWECSPLHGPRIICGILPGGWGDICMFRDWRSQLITFL